MENNNSNLIIAFSTLAELEELAKSENTNSNLSVTKLENTNPSSDKVHERELCPICGVGKVYCTINNPYQMTCMSCDAKRTADLLCQRFRVEAEARKAERIAALERRGIYSGYF